MNENKENLPVASNGNSVVTSNSSAMDIIQLAMDKDLDINKIEGLLKLKADFDKGEAEKAFTRAMAAFKKEPPEILKDKHVNYTTKTGSKVDYNHATLGNVCHAVSLTLSKHGFSASWKTEQPDGAVKVTCTLTHKMGHSESTSLQAPPDSSGGKNTIQAIASTVSYLERYTLLAMVGLATHDQDDDGRGAGQGVECVSEKQQGTIRDLLISINYDEMTFLNHFKWNSIEEIPLKSYTRAVNALEKRGKKQ